MEYQEIDLETWERREYFDHYTQEVPCRYSTTVKLDITALRSGRERVYPAMLYLLTKTVCEFDAFRYTFRSDGKLFLLRDMHPSYTVFDRGTGRFSCIWTAYTEDYGEFRRRYEEDVRMYGVGGGFCPKPDMPGNCFNVSMMPWVAFESFHLQTPDYRYLLPVFTMGRFQESQGRCMLPLAVQVHHAVCDGFHLGQFLDSLQSKLLAWGA